MILLRINKINTTAKHLPYEGGEITTGSNGRK